MLRLSMVLALALLACTPVRADEFESYDAAPLNACIDAAEDDDEVGMRACLGASAIPCIQAEGGATNGYVLCWGNEAGTWRERMDAATAHLNASGSYRDPERLTAANAAWEAWAQAECEYWAWEEGGGVGEQVDRARCIARVNAERAIALIIAGAEP